jgi:hypothetical protein
MFAFLTICADKDPYASSVLCIPLLVLTVLFSVTKKLKWFKKTSPNQRRVLVSEEWKRKFLAKPMTFYDYENITPSQERMIFQVSVCAILLYTPLILTHTASTTWHGFNPSGSVPF